MWFRSERVYFLLLSANYRVKLNAVLTACATDERELSCHIYLPCLPVLEMSTTLLVALLRGCHSPWGGFFSPSIVRRLIAVRELFSDASMQPIRLGIGEALDFWA